MTGGLQHEFNSCTIPPSPASEESHISRLTQFKSVMAPTGGYFGNQTEGGQAYLDIAASMHDYWFPRTGGTRFNFPVGPRILPTVVTPSLGVPQVVPQTNGPSQIAHPPAIDRRDIPQDGHVVQKMLKPFYVKQALSAAETASMEAAGYQVIVGTAPHSQPVSTPPIIAPPLPTKPKATTMDLGSLLTDLGTAYIQTKYAPPPVQTFSGPVPTTPAYSAFDAGSDIIDFFTDPATGTVVPVKKKKKCRRRRRRLATKSDLGDLAALKAILGNGATFTAWIATHGR